jgi:hypothetical protein
MSTSAEGSVKGKCEARKRSSHLVDLEEGAAEFLQRPFQVGHADVAINRQPFDLVEHRRVGLVHVHPVDAARRDDADRRALFGHRADLHRRGMGAQHMRRAGVAVGPRHEERVMLLPRGVFRRDVQRVEVVPVGFHLRPLGHREPHVGENRGQLFHHLRHRMDRAARARPARQGHVQPFRFQPFIQRRIAQRGLAGAQGGVDLVLQRVQARASRLALLGLHLAQGSPSGPKSRPSCPGRRRAPLPARPHPQRRPQRQGISNPPPNPGQ